MDAVEFAIRRDSDVTLSAMTVASSPRYLQAFPRDERGVIGTVVSELATNIIKYAGQGTIRIEPLVQEGRLGVRVQAIDQGPGIVDVEAALRDGFSTGGTLGLGLPAVRRLTDSLHILCPVGGGTHVEAIRWARRAGVVAPDARGAKVTAPKAQAASRPLELRVETRHKAYRSHTVCGDRSWQRHTNAYTLLAHLDGTGHGHAAHEATGRIVRAAEGRVGQWPEQPDATLLRDLLGACHEAAVGTVGAALTLALIDRVNRAVHHLGVGNTCIMSFTPSGWEGVSRPGVIGQRFRPPVVETHGLSEGDTLVFFSDGLSSSQVRQQRRRSDRPTDAPAIADLLMGSAKPDDDASCMVVACA